MIPAGSGPQERFPYARLPAFEYQAFDTQYQAFDRRTLKFSFYPVIEKTGKVALRGTGGGKGEKRAEKGAEEVDKDDESVADGMCRIRHIALRRLDIADSGQDRRRHSQILLEQRQRRTPSQTPKISQMTRQYHRGAHG